MADSPVMYALRAKRSELAGLAKVAERDLAKLYADLEAIDGALRVFDPTIQLAVIRPKVIRAKPDARFGRFTSLMMVVLREAAEPLTAAGAPEGYGTRTAARIDNVLLNP